MLVTELCKDFIAIAPKQKGYARTTLKQYRLYLEGFCAWLGTDAALDQFNEVTLCRYQAYKLTNFDYRPRTINHLYGALIAFGDWLVKRRLLTHNPAKVLEKVKLDEPIRHEISDEDAFALIAACDRVFRERRRLMCRAVLCILVHGGLRHSEVINLTLESFSVNDRMLRVKKGKGGKSRDVPLIKEAVDAIDAWIKIRPDDCRPEPLRRNNLFMFNRQQPLGSQGLVNIIKEASLLADYKKHVTPHSFRHAYATRLIRNSGDIKAVSELLGHTQASTTLNIYAHTNEDRKRAVAEMSGLVSSPPQMQQAAQPMTLPASPAVATRSETQPARDIAAPGQDKRLSHRASIRLPR